MSKTHTSSIANKMTNGTYVRNSKFAEFGSVIEDSIMAQQREFELRLLAIQAKKDRKKNNV